MRNPVRADHCQLQCRRIGDTGAIGIGNGFAELFGQLFNLLTGAMNDDNLNAQTSQHGDIQQQVVEVIVGDDGAVDGDDKDFVAKLRNVMEDSA